MAKDRIQINDLLVRGIVGVNDWERKDKQDILINLELLADLRHNEEPTISEALHSILTRMEQFIEYRGDEAWIANPVNPAENFADKWSKEPAKRGNFFFLPSFVGRSTSEEYS